MMNNFAFRLISLVCAAAVVLVVVLYPRSIAETSADVPHGFLALLMMGMSGAWIHGFGFIPQNRVLKLLFSPLIAWPLMLLGVWGVFF